MEWGLGGDPGHWDSLGTRRTALDHFLFSNQMACNSLGFLGIVIVTRKERKKKKKGNHRHSLPNLKNMNWSTNSSDQITINSLPFLPETQMGSSEITFCPTIHNFFSPLFPVTGPEVVISGSPSPARPPLMLRKTGGMAELTVMSLMHLFHAVVVSCQCPHSNLLLSGPIRQKVYQLS